MNITYAAVGIENPYSKRRIDAETLVDSDTMFFTVPEHLAIHLGYDPEAVSTRNVIFADGSRKSVPMIAPLRVHFADRYCDLSALVMGDQPIFGAVPMEMMDLVVHPASKKLMTIPDNLFAR